MRNFNGGKVTFQRLFFQQIDLSELEKGRNELKKNLEQSKDYSKPQKKFEQDRIKDKEGQI